jgi:hypothetical protein
MICLAYNDSNKKKKNFSLIHSSSKPVTFGLKNNMSFCNDLHTIWFCEKVSTILEKKKKMGVKRVDKTRKVFAFVWWLISKEVDLFLFYY